MSNIDKIDSRIYWIWLQQRLGYANHAAHMVTLTPGGARKVYESSDDELRAMGHFTQRQIEKLRDKSLDDVYKIIEDCTILGYGIITPEDKMYPNRMRNIYNSPMALYVWGTFPDIDDEAAIAIVGTRRASSFGRSTAQELAERLAQSGSLIVSGGAPGVDTASHSGAMKGKGKTIAVLGCGINYRYNVEGERLRRDIAQNGAVISEYPPGYAAYAPNFPLRNRIIAALSLGVVVIEAGMRSGALITVDCALEQNRDVYAVPGRIGDPRTAGSNKMISDGAKAVLCPYDVVGEYIHRYPHRLRLAQSQTPLMLVMKQYVPEYEEAETAKPQQPQSERRTQHMQKPMQKAPRSKPAESVQVQQSVFEQVSREPMPEVQSTESRKLLPPPEPARPTVKAPVDEESESLIDQTLVQFTLQSKTEQLTKKAQLLLDELSDEPQTAGELMHKCGFSISETLGCLSELELEELVMSLPGGRYVRRNGR